MCRNFTIIAPMSDNSELFRQSLRRHGYSNTKVRSIVFAALEHQEPQTMADIIKRVTPLIDRASAYRTMSLFEELGIVHRIQIGWKYKLELSDEFHAHHHHISCVKCGQIEVIHEDAVIEQTIDTIAQRSGYQLISHQLELQGLCQNCRLKT